MKTKPTNISETMQEKAKVCATIAEDKIEESLTGESCEKEMNEAEAKAWKLKSEIWQEAAAVVQAGSVDQVPPVQK